jgi:chromosome segregation ATPase
LQQRDSNYLSEIERLNNSLRLKVDECVRWEQIEHELKNSVFNQEKQVLQRQEELEILTTKYASLGKESKTQKEHLAEYELRYSPVHT